MSHFFIGNVSTQRNISVQQRYLDTDWKCTTSISIIINNNNNNKQY